MAFKRIFLVSDSPEFLLAVRQFVHEESEFKVVGFAHSCRDALCHIPELQPDIVLLDPSLPILNALEATRILKAQPDAPAVVIVTSHQSPEFRAAVTTAGADGFVSKVQFEEQLLPVLNGLFRSDDFWQHVARSHHENQPDPAAGQPISTLASQDAIIPYHP